MDDNKRLEEANKEVEKSKSMLGNLDDKKDEQTETSQSTEQGSGIFTADGKELPEIEGGYDLIDPGGSLADDDIVST